MPLFSAQQLESDRAACGIAQWTGKSFAPFGWPGGKFYLACHIAPLIPPHVCYCEVFGGAGWLLFHKEPSRCEIYNDINSELVNCYRQLVRNPRPLLAKARHMLRSRELFMEELNKDPEQLSESDRAWRFLYIRWMSHSQHSARFAIAKTDNRRCGSQSCSRRIRLAHARLERVIIENDDWAAIIKRYDAPETFFYLDPPYMGYEDMYGPRLFCESAFGELAETLAGIRGKFILSINDCEKSRDIFKNFCRLEITARYSFNQKRRARELLISGEPFRETWRPLQDRTFGGKKG